MSARIAALVVTAVLLLAASGCAGEPTSPQPSASAPPASSEAERPITDALAHRLDTAVNQAMTAAGVPGAIIGIWGPDGTYIRAFGVADKTTRTPMKTDLYSRIGSVTKTFTVTGVLQLADQGKFGLDDPIAKFVDGVPQGDKITLRQLARMQSGLFNYSASPAFQQAMFADPRQAFTPHELLNYAFAQPNRFPPGDGFEYCNTNTVLLGLVVEKVSGQSLHSYIQDHIVTPLGMSHTSFPTTNAFPEPHPQGYTVQTADGKEAAATDWNPSWGWAAGAMISTLDDMRIWAPALATGMPPQDGYGLGIFNLGGWIGHNGSLPGYQTVAVYLPEKQTTLVILINTDIEYQGSEPSTALATAITKELTPDHVYSLGS
jgi:D-alanyl-D-alanine carboxypeptidase